MDKERIKRKFPQADRSVSVSVKESPSNEAKQLLKLSSGNLIRDHLSLLNVIGIGSQRSKDLGQPTVRIERNNNHIT